MKNEPGSTNKNNKLFLTDYQLGLTTTEAKRRLELYGKNTLPEQKKISWIKVFLGQFKDLMNLILIAISLILTIKAVLEITILNQFERSLLSFSEPIIILLVVVLNALLATQQLAKTTKAISSLTKLTIPTAKVIRDGEGQVINASELTLGDIILLESGDLIPADAKLIEAPALRVVESALTGESISVDKIVSKQAIETKEITINQTDYIYSGTHIVNGSAKAIVVAIGEKTQIGNIKTLVDNATKPKTPFQKQLNRLAKMFAYLAFLLFGLSFILELTAQGFKLDFNSYLRSLVNAAALAIGFVPEGLIVFSNAILVLNIKELSKHKVIVKGIQTVETLGATTFICTDKTGTLTKNKMQLRDYFSVEFGRFRDEVIFKDELCFLALANEASWPRDGEEAKIGDPTDLAILNFCIKNKISDAMLKEKFTTLKLAPFSSERRLMSVLVFDKERYYLIIKGGFDTLAKVATNLKTINILEKLNKLWASSGKRVLALGFKELTRSEAKRIQDGGDIYTEEKDISIISIFALEDPVRAEIINSINTCQKAKINFAMITGDHRDTAIAIAKKVGIYNSNSIAITGEELDELDDQELLKNLKRIKVFSRVSPKHKLRIVKLLQSTGEVITMIGDGINDSPALRSADVGCAMGGSGSDISKEASDVILVEDTFSSIVEGIYQGRKVFHRIKTVIKNLLISSASCVFSVILGLALLPSLMKYFGKETTDFYIYSGTQLLFMNLLTHGFPAISLGLIEPDVDVFKSKTNLKKRGILGGKNIFEIIIIGGIIGILSNLVWAYTAFTRAGLASSEIIHISSSASFITFGLATVINALNLLDEESIFKFKKNYKLVYIAVGLSALLMLFAFFLPGFRDVFNISKKLTNISNIDIVLIAITASLLPTIILETWKLIKKLAYFKI